MPFCYDGVDIEGEFALSACHPTIPTLLAAATRTTPPQLITLSEDDISAASQGARAAGVTGSSDTLRFLPLSKALQGSGSPTQLLWHPLKQWLAIAWANGTVGVWSEYERNLREGNAHVVPITCLQWSLDGSRLISGDQDGEVNVWKVDQRGRPAGLCRYRLNGAVTQCLFCPANGPGTQENQQARADTKRTRSSGSFGSASTLAPSPSFFLTTATGKVYYADASGHCTEHFTCNTAATAPTASGTAPAAATGASNLLPLPIVSVLYFAQRESLVVLSEDLTLTQVPLEDGGSRFGAVTQVKLSAGTEKRNVHALWIGPGLLGLCTGGQIVKVWDLIRDENESLVVPAAEDARINCITYHHIRHILAGGTDTGHIVMWKSRMVRDDHEEKRVRVWDPLPKINVSGSIESLQWGISPTASVLYARKKTGIRVLYEQSMIYAWSSTGRIAAVQIDKSRVVVWKGGVSGKGAGNTIVVDLLQKAGRAKSIAVCSDHLAVCQGKTIETYEFSSDPSILPTQTGSFPAGDSHCTIVVDSRSVFVPSGNNRIDVCTFQGAVKQAITWPEYEGNVVEVTMNGEFLVVTTSSMYVKCYQVAGHEIKLVISRSVEKQGTIMSAKSNCNGTLISFLAVPDVKQQTGSLTQHQLYVLDVEKGKLSMFDFTEFHVHPLSHYWDAADHRLLVCQTEVARMSSCTSNSPNATGSALGRIDRAGPITAAQSTSAKGVDAADEAAKEDPAADEVKVETEIMSMFWTPDQGILVQDRMRVADDKLDALIGVYVPYVYFIKTTDVGVISATDLIAAQPMRDFTGLEEGDTCMTKAMMDFSYFLTIGNMDEAFKAVKLIRSNAVWENMARLCVKTGRVDVASVCLGNMGNAQAVGALRSASTEKEPEVKVAAVAMHLGMYDDASRLYESCGRYDLLNQLYQGMNKWDKALEIAAQKDRIGLRNTYYKFARYLESCGDRVGAVAAYEKSGTYMIEVPRMLLNDEGELEKYMQESQDKELRKWRAQFAESKGLYDVALKYYDLAEDFLSVVRLLCYTGNIKKAHEIAERTQHPAAAYHLAKQYESQHKIRESIVFYTKAKCFNHAIRLAKEHKMDGDLMHLALQGSPRLMMEVARYYEWTGVHYDRAVALYHKGGHLSKAIDLCFRTEHFNLLRDLADELGKDTDPALLRKCASFFMKHGQFDKAVRLLIAAEEFDKALELCVEKNIPITEEMAESMTLEKIEGDEEREEKREQILHKVAEACMQQGSFHLACKKFTQAGDRLKAMKALLKSGDTQRIIFFAGVSGAKQREIFVIAANYLQTLDWKNDAEVTKSIISFYTKAKAYDSLAGFFDACAQVEIDEYQNFEKAYGALKEAMKCMNKAKAAANRDVKLAALQRRIDLVGLFVQARKAAKVDAEEMFRLCQKLTEQPDVETAIRVGDVYALMIETAYVSGMHEQAQVLLRKMRQRVGPSVPLEYYLDARILLEIDPTSVKGVLGSHEIGDEI